MTTKRLAALTSCLLFLACFALYLHTLNPVFAADDSPETIASCATLGVQHPPGYPLHTLLGRLFSLLPLGNTGFRLNLMAGFFGGLAACLLYLNLRLFLAGVAPGLAAGRRAGLAAMFSLSLACSPTFWSQCLSAKGGIYTLQTALLLALLLCVQQACREAERRLANPQSSRWRLFQTRPVMGAFLCLGLGLANHWETQIVVLPPLALLAGSLAFAARVDAKLASNRRLASHWAWCSGFMAAGLSLYLMLPLRSRLFPAMDWGHPADWAQLRWVLMRQEYLDLETGFLKALAGALAGKATWHEVARQWDTVAAQAMRALHHLISELGWLVVGLSVAGLVALFKTGKKRLPVFFAALLACFVLVVVFYFKLPAEMIWIMDVFMLPAYLAQAALACLGAAWILQWPGLSARVRGLALPALGLLLIAARLPGGTMDQSSHFWAYDFGRDLLAEMKPRALFLAEGDFNVMPVYYLQTVEGRRRDVVHVTSIFLSLPWGVRQVQRRHPELGLDLDPGSVPPSGPLFHAAVEELMDKNKGIRPVQISMFHEVTRQFYPAAEAALAPAGLAFEAWAPSGAAEEKRRRGLLASLRTRHAGASLEGLHPSTQFMLSNYATAYLEEANHLRSLGPSAWPQARLAYLSAIRMAPPQNRAEAWTHYGIGLADLPDYPAAIQAFQEAIKVKPLFEAYSNLAGIYNNIKRYQEGLQNAQKAVEINPQAGEAYNNIAIAQYYLGHRSEALAAMREASRLNPQNATLAANLKAMENGAVQAAR